MTEIPSRSIWIVDIDGTVALMNGRGPFDWTEVRTDLPNVPVITVVRALHSAWCEIVFMTGRMRQCREATNEWLAEYVGSWAQVDEVFMRPDDDYRPDEVLKKDLFDALVASNHDGWYQVAGVIDDRSKVVTMWRSLGLTCLQVAEGNF